MLSCDLTTTPISVQQTRSHASLRQIFRITCVDRGAVCSVCGHAARRGCVSEGGWGRTFAPRGWGQLGIDRLARVGAHFIATMWKKSVAKAGVKDAVNKTVTSTLISGYKASKKTPEDFYQVWAPPRRIRCLGYFQPSVVLLC